jgi:hypothetical protein
MDAFLFLWKKTTYGLIYIYSVFLRDFVKIVQTFEIQIIFINSIH